MTAFALKKVLGMLLMPIPLTLLMLLLALWYWQRRPRVSRTLVAGALLWLGLTSWHPLADRLLAPFENQYPRFDLAQPVAAVVVLGGCHASDPSVPPAAQLCSSSLFRLTEGLRILTANPQAQLLVSGYAGSDQRPHAEVMQSIAIALGVDPLRIRALPQPRDTAEEAALMAPLLRGKVFALVSEASHLPRALPYFTAQGLTPVAAPAMKMSSPESDWRIEARAALKSERAFYEGLGRVWQWLRS